MKKLFVYLPVVCLMIVACVKEASINIADEKTAINSLLNNWHNAAAKADYNAYFGKIAEDGIYIGTDAGENWNKKEFEVFAKPYFDKGKAWNFTALERHIFFSKDGKTAWFDELLDTQMKTCRGSGILEMQGKEWKIKHYVLSLTIPNDAVQEVLPLKGRYEDSMVEKIMAERKQ
ncbi:MAG: hypothetical protein EOO45_22755 [Flavobacterium sp.]|nr:MAG: hypothetical protein EOO45_22755 [Flavobacterium sp.]